MFLKEYYLKAGDDQQPITMETLKYRKIRNKGYGQRWQDFKIHYVGERPKLLRDDGAFSSGKSLLEALAMKFRNFKLILTPEESRIKGNASAPQVCVALPELQKLNAGLFSQKKYVTQQAVSHLLSSLFPKDFAACQAPLSATAPLPATAPPPAVIRKKSVPRKLKGRFNLRALRRLAREMKKRIETHRAESTWRKFLRENILSIQRGYIELIPKADLELSGASYPGFFLITSDGYLEIPEIKSPFTELLSYDEASRAHVWSVEIAGAVARVENHLQSVSRLRHELRKKVKDCCGIELPVIKPRGIIFAGNSAQFKGNRKAREGFELLNAASQHATVVTYDELLTRLRNHVAALSGSKEKKG